MKNSISKYWPVLVAAIFVTVLAFACGGDEKEDAPVFGAGTYDGTYTVIRDFLGEARTKVDTMAFYFWETGSVDTLIMDHSAPMNGEHNFCDYVCTWRLVGDSLRITFLSQSLDICVEEENPGQTYLHFVDGRKFVFVKFDTNTYPPAPNTDIYRKIELWAN